MTKIQFSDVVPPERRSIRDIPIPNGGKRKVPVIIRPQSNEKNDESFSEMLPEAASNAQKKGPYEYYYPQRQDRSNSQVNQNKKNGKKKFIFIVLALVAIFVFVFSMMTVFSSASLVLVPKSQEIDVSMNLVAVSDNDQSGVKYEIIKFSKIKNEKVEATAEEAVENKASGKIIIYNNFSTEPQRLIVRTRFETPDGLIFRIPESVNVPGKSIKNGIETPGSVEVEVFADEAGEKYNIEKTDFTIPGFKNDASRFKGFYARSSTEMSGGFVGKMKTVSEQQRIEIMDRIEKEAQEELKMEIKSKIPSDLVLVDGSVFFQSKDVPQSEESSLVILGKEITAYALALDRRDLSEGIISAYQNQLVDWKGIVSYIDDFSGLKIINSPEDVDFTTRINLEIKGLAKVIAQINTQEIGERLIAAPKKEAGNLINDVPGIVSVTATIRPMWKQTFPSDSSKIEIKTSPNN